MTLNEKVVEDMKTAMKSGEKIRLETLRTIRAQLLEKEVERRPAGNVTPDDEIAVLSAAAKKRKQQAQRRTAAGADIAPAAAFVEIGVDTSRASAAALELVLGQGRLLRIGRGFDAELLRQLLSVLEQPSC